MWKKNGKGKEYAGRYTRDAKGERVMVLLTVKSTGEVHTVTAESWQMLKAIGWVKV